MTTDAQKRRMLAYHSVYYDHVRELPGGLAWAGIKQQIENTQIIRASFTNPFGWEDGWSFPDYEAAVAALESWTGEPGTEPSGWIRSVRSGMPTRRRPDGDPTREYELE